MATGIPTNLAAFSLSEVARLTGGVQLGGAATRVVGVATDTRGDLRGKLFVALRGERFDGHQFIERAVRQGAAAVLAEDVPASVTGVKVASALDALSLLARAHRRRWAGRVIAVAGSAGKTTTRSVSAALLGALLGERLHGSPGNLNNRIGLPMVLLGLEPTHQLALLEVGTNRSGEVAALTATCEPDVCVLTLIDLEHTEGLGGLDAIEREEAAILRPEAELLLGNGDDERVARQLAAHPGRSLSYGFRVDCDYCIEQAEITAACVSDIAVRRPNGSRVSFASPFVGAPGALACAAALALAEHEARRALDGPWIEAALRRPEAREPGRLQPIELADDTLVLDDSYNANPASMRAALTVARRVADLRGARLHVVLGEMRELGPWSVSEHRKLRGFVAAARPESTTAIGGDARELLDGARATSFTEDSNAAATAVLPHVQPGDVVLIKASRGVKAELVVQALIDARGRKL